MVPIVDELEIEFKEKVAVKRIDCDQSKELVKELNISGVPVFIIYKKGKEVWRHNGLIEKAELIKKMNAQF
jgi:thioredoxin-like negative regulator of GroEL